MPTCSDPARRHPTGAGFSRRQALGGIAATVGLGASGGYVAAAPQADLRKVVVDAVGRLAPDRAIPLKLLMPNGSGASLRPVTQFFTRLTGVRIELQEVPFDNISAKLLIDKMGGLEGVDIALPATYSLPDLVTADVIAPLDAYVGKYEPKGFREGILYSVGDSFEDRTYGFQTDGDAYVMFYHSDMIRDPALRMRYEDRFGTKLEVPLTWAELDRQMAFFHAPDKGRFGGCMLRTQSMVVWEWWIRLHAKGIWPLAADMTPQFDGSAGVEALDDMIRASAYQTPDVWSAGMFENWARYTRGDVYCAIGWGGTFKFVNRPDSKVRQRMVFGPTPGGIVGGELLLTPYFNWGWDYVVTTASRRPELAYLFCLFAASPEISTLAVRQTGSFFDPFRPEHYTDTGIQEAYSLPFLDVQRHSLEQAIPDFYLRGRSEYFRVLGQGLISALTGEVRPDVALQHVAQVWEMITSRAGRETQAARWKELRAKYPANARRILSDTGT